MRKAIITIMMLSACLIAGAQEWSSYSVPANPGAGKQWVQLDSHSDDFNFTMAAGIAHQTNGRPARFTNKWYAYYHNSWKGPGHTTWNPAQVWADGDKLAIQAVPVPNSDEVYCGIITSKTQVQYPLYFEIYAKIMNQSLANGFWLLSPDDTQEIDCMEGYGGGAGQEWFAQRMHLSHHVFVRSPFQDYQPTDAGSWHYSNGTYWRGAFHRYGCHWKDPWTLEYYIDGTKVRTVSGANMIDPNNYTNGTGLNKAMDMIIDAENQTDWKQAASDAELASDNIFWIDWVRTYKAQAGGSSSSGGSSSGGSSSGGSSSSSGGTDLAAGKSSFQSSTYQNNNDRFGSGKVVDNNGATFNHTNNQSGAWWEVDLGSNTNISTVKIWNRGDCCQNRLQNFDIKIYNSRGGTQTKSVYVSGQPSVNGSTYNINGTGRVVRVQLRGSNFLHMDQVSVYGTPASSSSSSGGSSSSSSGGGQHIALQNQGNNKYVSSENGTTVMTCNKSNIGGWEKFQFVDAGGGQYALLGSNGRYVSSENGNSQMTCNRTAIGGWEKFTFVDYGNDVYAIKGNNGKYVRANMWCNNDVVGTWQKFKVIRGLNKGAVVAEKATLSERFSIYPNPVNDQLNITIEGELQQDASIIIYNSTGMLVSSTPISNNELQLYTGDFLNGMYILKLINGSEVISKTFFRTSN